MSYRLISSNDIAIKYPEVNDMPCIYADLPNGMDGEHYVLEQEPKTGHWEWLTENKYRCSNCNHETRVDECFGKPMYDFCPFCRARMESEE
jgi:hypothetical protein